MGGPAWKLADKLEASWLHSELAHYGILCTLQKYGANCSCHFLMSLPQEGEISFNFFFIALKLGTDLNRNGWRRKDFTRSKWCNVLVLFRTLHTANNVFMTWFLILFQDLVVYGTNLSDNYYEWKPCTKIMEGGTTQIFFEIHNFI